jgi:hypothetical protein
MWGATAGGPALSLLARSWTSEYFKIFLPDTVVGPQEGPSEAKQACADIGRPEYENPLSERTYLSAP